jgi:carbamoyl-phosphate synthase large subunit
MAMEKRVLIPGAGGPGAINMTRSLLSAKEKVFLVGCDASPFYIHLALTHEKVLVPRASDEDAYINAINEIVARFDLNFIMPNSSIEMMVLTRNKDRLLAPMYVPSLKTQELSADKFACYERWLEKGISVPKSIKIDKPEDIERAFDEIKTRPVWFRGTGIPGRGVGMAALPCKKPLEALGWIEYHNGFGKFMAAEYLPGENLTFLGIFRDGELVTSQGRQRDLYVIPHVSPSGITGAPAVSHTVCRDDLNELGHKAILAIDEKFRGVAFVDVKADASGRLCVTEINAGRFGTTHHFYTAAGRNMPFYLLKIAFGEEIGEDLPKYNALPPDLYWIRTLDGGPRLMTRAELGL